MTPAKPRQRGKGQQASDAWESIMVAYTTLTRAFATDEVWQDLTMREYDVLYTLAKCRNSVRLHELHDHVLLSQPALSRLVDRLVTRELVRREVDTADRRGIKLSLTEGGRKQQRLIGARHGLAVARIVNSRLTRTEQAELERICHKLVDGDA